MSGPGDLQACPWCQFVGTPKLFDLHMQIHEAKDEELRQGITAHQYQLAHLEIMALKEKLEAAETVASLTQAEVLFLKADSKMMRAMLKERQTDYAKTIKGLALRIEALAEELETRITELSTCRAELSEANWMLDGLRK